MDAVLRGAVIYLFVLIIIRISGRRSLAKATTFDLVLIIMIAEATQQGLLGDDFSITNAVLVVLTLAGLDIVFSMLKAKSIRIETWIDGTPTIILENGRPIKDRMNKARVDEADILESARRLQGIERLDQIKYAVLEKTGGISIIPKER